MMNNIFTDYEAKNKKAFRERRVNEIGETIKTGYEKSKPVIKKGYNNLESKGSDMVKSFRGSISGTSKIKSKGIKNFKGLRL